MFYKKLYEKQLIIIDALKKELEKKNNIIKEIEKYANG